ncbi:hypothetical protein [Oligella urethralis]|uniref:Uncharacterized protein n=1 Tax=Oligella urethralis DNF00040 TaxID=1401065 RepID=A0A095YSH6_9BURK|nr:hypothetical protein [Oligella urethralis]KGF25355.1 hypothetical protein HMPREF2130_11245 [Oligella urethralis DNF00040]
MKTAQNKIIRVSNASTQEVMLKNLYITLRKQDQLSKASSYIHQQIKEQAANKKAALERGYTSLRIASLIDV